MADPAPKNRFHVNLSVTDLSRSVRFYTDLFGQPPAFEKDDYARWLLDDPLVHFSLTTHGAGTGVDHVGIQAADEAHLATIRARLSRADAPTFEQPDVTCCYARSTKTWTRDPDGLAWETFLTHGATTEYGDGTRHSAVDDARRAPAARSCCEAGQ